MTRHELELACTWAGPVFVAVFFGGIMLAGWLPPLSANQTADEVAALYRDHGDRIALGATMIATAALPQALFTALMSRHLRRLEGDRPLWTYTQLAGGAIGIIVVIIPWLLFSAAAFRPDRDPAITQALHDAGWMALVGTAWPAMVQALAVGVAVLRQRGAAEVFPRWFGWLNLWVALAFVPGPFLVLFATGPFAWHGAAVFWLPATVFGVFLFSWFLVLRRAIADEARAAAAGRLTAVEPDVVAADEVEVA